MHTFMTAILFRMSRIRVDRFDAEFDEPNREGREPSQGSGAGKRGTVVGMDLLWEAIFSENRSKYGL
jgi:hypothetical protein